MFKLALVALLCAQAFARPQEGGIESHIVGSTPAREGEYPFAVSIRGYDGYPLCSGVLISDRFVLTTVSCIRKEIVLMIGAGSFDLSKQQIFEVDKYIPHPEVDPIFTYNDIALLRLETPVKLGGNITTINFPVKDNLDGKTVTAMGWGTTGVEGPPSNVLMTLKRQALSNKECAQIFKHYIFDSQICIQGERNSGMLPKDDTGSPLVYKAADGKYYVAGVSSWGHSHYEGKPDVFTRISSFVQWLNDNMK